LNNLVVFFVVQFHTFVKTPIVVVSDSLFSSSSDSIVMLKDTKGISENVINHKGGVNLLLGGRLVKHFLGVEDGRGVKVARCSSDISLGIGARSEVASPPIGVTA
jgi:hypothetical protein